jgi:ABC-type Fe3+-hydroxamate transport system substrate-binding protein
MLFHDALGHEWQFDSPPRRIVSLVPSTTESLFELGVADRLVACTEYCLNPAAAAKLLKVGGPKNPDLARIRGLKPDVIFANQEENTRAGLEALLADGLRVVVFFPRTVRKSLADLRTQAAITGAPNAAEILDEIDRVLADMPEPTLPARVFVPIWREPWMTFNADTFASDLMTLCGAQNVFADRERRYPLAADYDLIPPVDAADRDTRYPRIKLDAVRRQRPDWVWLPDEPYAFDDRDAADLAAICCSGMVPACDGRCARFRIG